MKEPWVSMDGRLVSADGDVVGSGETRGSMT